MHMTSLIIVEQTKKCEKNIIRKCKCNAIIERNELQIMTYKNHDPDILDHFFQKKCLQSCLNLLQL